MEAFVGTWQDIGHDNLPAFLEASGGMGKGVAERFKDAKVYHDVWFEGEDIHSKFYTTTGLEVKNVFPLGKECISKGMDGTEYQSVLKFSDGKFHEIHIMKKEPKLTVTIEREINSEGEMIITMEVKGIKDTGRMKKIK